MSILILWQLSQPSNKQMEVEVHCIEHLSTSSRCISLCWELKSGIHELVSVPRFVSSHRLYLKFILMNANP